MCNKLNATPGSTLLLHNKCPTEWLKMLLKIWSFVRLWSNIVVLSNWFVITATGMMNLSSTDFAFNLCWVKVQQKLHRLLKSWNICSEIELKYQFQVHDGVALQQEPHWTYLCIMSCRQQEKVSRLVIITSAWSPFKHHWICSWNRPVFPAL